MRRKVKAVNGFENWKIDRFLMATEVNKNYEGEPPSLNCGGRWGWGGVGMPGAREEVDRVV